MNNLGRTCQSYLLLFGVVLAAACDDDPGKTLMVDVPDLTQTLISGSSHGDGQMYCAPVAVSNSLVWLFGETDQISLVKNLASPSYMNTNLKNGTGTTELLRGVVRYLNARDVKPTSLLYQGWRKHLYEYGTGEIQPTVDFIKMHVGLGRSAWLNIGWYKKEGSNFRRVGGHWVTLVGHSKTDADVIYLNDPSPRSGLSEKSHKVTVKSLNTGRMTGKKSGLPVNAHGFLEVTSGLYVPDRADAAIIDGVVGIQL